MRRLSALDAQFLAAERGNAGSHYCGLAIYDTGDGSTINAARTRQLLRDRIGGLPPLRWKVTTVPFDLDHPVFVETDVDLDDHVSESTLPAPADEAALAAEVAAIMSTRLDRSKPLWKMQVIHGLPGRTAVVTTLHHAAIDGIAAGEVFAALHDVCGEVGSTHAEQRELRPEPTPSRVELAARGLVSLPFHPVRAVRSAARAVGHLDQVPSLRSLPGIQTVAGAARREFGAARLDAPRTRFNAKLSDGRSVAFGTVSFGDVKIAKRELGVTVNDVVIALCAGALRRRLETTGDLPAAPLVAYIPVSTRVPDAKDRYGNAISSIIAPIPTHLPGLCDRIAFSYETLAHAKQRAKKAPPTLLSDVNGPIPAPFFGFLAGGLMDLIGSRFVRPPVNLIMSNVPGSPVALESAGASLLAHYPLSCVFDGFALNITVVSYQDGLDIGIVGDAQGLPDDWELIDDFRSEMAELSELISSERSSN
jgi:WS/DGAT/MGAT family acyltransferase